MKKVAYFFYEKLRLCWVREIVEWGGEKWKKISFFCAAYSLWCYHKKERNKVN
jgi:hypothetical protein